MMRYLPAFGAMVLVAASGLAHGLWTSRWHTDQELQDAVVRVPQFPLAFGGWQGRELEVNAKEFASAGAMSYWARRYENKERKAAILVILMCGPAGRMAVHTPDVCYRGAGYETAGPADRVDVPVAGSSVPAQLWTARFVKQQPLAGAPLRLFWSWGSKGSWQVPDYPRLAFAGEPALYKLYVVRELGSADDTGEHEPAFAFLGELLPELNKALFPAIGASKGEL